MKPVRRNPPAKQAQSPAFLRSALVEVERSFRQVLVAKRASITHSTSLGDAVEDSWISLLGRYLPARYRVAKAFAIDHTGQTTEQLDCLIYDAHFTPALFGEGTHLYVPAEAVYATFEIKQTVTTGHLRAACQKARSLRGLARTSVAIPWANGVNPPKPPSPILAGLLAMDASWSDGLGNQFLKHFALASDGQLDMVITANAGTCERMPGSGASQITRGPGSLIFGLFRLLDALRRLGTVPALDWSPYQDSLALKPEGVPNAANKRARTKSPRR